MQSVSRAPTSVALLVERARQFSSRPFIASLGHDQRVRRYTYLEAAARIAGIADWLAGFGLVKGTRVAAYLDAGDPGIWFYLGCAAAGVVTVPLGPSFSVESLGKLVIQCEARAVFTTPELVERLQGLSLPILTMSEDRPSVRGATVIPFSPAADPLSRLEACAKALSPDDIYCFQPTSGSTGVPKLVMRRNITFPYAGGLLVANQPVGEEGEAGLLVAAMTHGVGHYDVHRQLQLGGCVCIPRDIDVAVKLEDAEQLSPTSLATTPRVLRALLQAHAARYGERAADTPFLSPNLRRVGIGGSVPDEALLKELERRSILVSEGYGATEVSLLSVTPFGARRPGSAGKISADVELRLAPDGELLARSPFRMAGYFGDEAASAAAFDAEGFYQTGDLAAIEPDGFLRILGRKRDVFNSSEGSNIYPARIEGMLEGLAEVRQAILIGDQRPFITALIVLTSAAASTDDDGLLDDKASYARVGAQIAEVNRKLEAFERVRRIALFAKPFDPALYRPVAQGKTARDRKQVLARYAAVIAKLYAGDEQRFVVGD